MNYNYSDCYFDFEDGILQVGNSLIKRRFRVTERGPSALELCNPQTGYQWAEEKPELLCVQLTAEALAGTAISVSAAADNSLGLSEQFLCGEVVWENSDIRQRWVLKVWPEQPFLTTECFVMLKRAEAFELFGDDSMQDAVTGAELMDQQANRAAVTEPDTIEAFFVRPNHVKLDNIIFSDVTDGEDTMVRSITQELYPRGKQGYTGNMFLLDAYLDQERLLMVKESLLSGVSAGGQTQLKNHEKLLKIQGTGLKKSDLRLQTEIPCYGSTVGVAYQKDMNLLYKDYYRKMANGAPADSLFIMSNTWGDRSQDTAICEAFILKELAAAEKMGVDILQIDDGWEKGHTINSGIKAGGVWEGYYSADPDFWEINSEKFPSGFDLIADTAREKNIRLALWFSPDSSNDFGNWERDAAVMLGLYRRYGICSFKLDGVKIRSKEGERNLIQMLERITAESKGRLTFNMDITAEVRFGYFYQKQYGTIFLENRYTDWGSYYPHRTLKNLWSLSKYIPAGKLQMEFLNPDRNRDVYGDDELAPYHYSIDYLFAVTIAANPLAWMELSGLSVRNQDLLKNIISVYNQEKVRLFNSDVRPVGGRPDGISFTGFHIVSDGDSGYFLLFREKTAADSCSFEMDEPDQRAMQITILYQSQCAGASLKKENKNTMRLTLLEPRSFLFASYRYAGQE